MKLWMRCGIVLNLLLALILSPVTQADASVVYLPIATTPAPIVQWAIVERVIDGDTFVATLECCECLPSIQVRPLGIDTPEVKGAECFNEEAPAALERMIGGQRVGLERDLSEADGFGRLLRHVYTEGDTWVNGALVAQGYARVMIVGDDTRYAEALVWDYQFLSRQRPLQPQRRVHLDRGSSHYASDSDSQHYARFLGLPAKRVTPKDPGES